jgi:hypothetical protein
MRPALLDLDEDNLCAIARHQINLTRQPTPATRANHLTTTLIKARHLIFGRFPGVI